MIFSEDYVALTLQTSGYFWDKGVEAQIQLLKLQEELGEVAEAYIGWMGLNPRKGVTHTKEDVGAELADVIMTAVVTMHFFGLNPNKLMEEQAAKVRARLDQA